MNKKELVKVAAEKSEMTQKDMAKALDCIQDVIISTLKDGEPVALTGFGKFEVRARAGRSGINPTTMEKIQIPPTLSPAFKPSKNFKDTIKNG